MTHSAHDQLEQHWSDLNNRFVVEDRPELGALVTANGNARAPIHRWFRMKEAYSSKLPAAVLSPSVATLERGVTIHDPFSGSGTTGVAAAEIVRQGLSNRATILASEVNPFLHLVSAAKFAALERGVKDLDVVAGRVARRAMQREDGISPQPALSTFARQEYFSAAVIEDLGALRASIAASDVSDDQRLYMLVAAAAQVEPASHLRRDGRTLRYAPQDKPVAVVDAFLDSIRAMHDDAAVPVRGFSSDLRLMDSRLPVDDWRDIADAAIFSPPYPNNIDYTEVYKLEAWFVGAYDSHDAMRLQRYKTVRSHSSLRWASTVAGISEAVLGEVRQVVSPLLDAVPEDRYAVGRREVIEGYAVDMYSVLTQVHQTLTSEGRMALVVGNSLHGKSGQDYCIASDLILARIAEIIGFSDLRVAVARHPKRRAGRSAFLRESVLTASAGK